MILPLDICLISYFLTLLRPHQLSCCFSGVPYFIPFTASVLVPLSRTFLCLEYLHDLLTQFIQCSKIQPLRVFCWPKNSPPYSVILQHFSVLPVMVFQGLVVAHPPPPPVCYILWPILLLLIFTTCYSLSLSSLFIYFISSTRVRVPDMNFCLCCS